jgi:hypothetical protein
MRLIRTTYARIKIFLCRDTVFKIHNFSIYYNQQKNITFVFKLANLVVN